VRASNPTILHSLEERKKENENKREEKDRKKKLY
jgi:hypothetical protein